MYVIKSRTKGHSQVFKDHKSSIGPSVVFHGKIFMKLPQNIGPSGQHISFSCSNPFFKIPHADLMSPFKGMLMA
jgi:hypothetical protein